MVTTVAEFGLSSFILLFPLTAAADDGVIKLELFVVLAILSVWLTSIKTKRTILNTETPPYIRTLISGFRLIKFLLPGA